jgi:2-keto-3-deoxy-L-rhamnonate aldolase RhmA
VRTNPVKQALREGKTVYGTMMVEFRSSAAAQILAAAGFDYFFIDMEHGTFGYETMSDMIRAGRMAGIAPMVRVSDCQYHLMSRPLDAGAMGLMIPRVETREQVEQIIRWTKYPPWGIRGCGASTGHSEYQATKVGEFIKHANEQVMVIPQIESEEAIQNIEQIVSVKGVDAAVFGPNDLSISLGVPGEVEHPKMVKAFERVLAACNEAGIACGLHVGRVDLVCKWKAKGMRFLCWSTDIGMIKESSAKGLAAMKGIA